MFEIDLALKTLVEREGSDLHVKVDSPPIARMHGELIPLEGFGQLSSEDTERAFKEIAEPRSLAEFEEDGEADFSYALGGVSRFRVNCFKQRGSISIVCRAIPFEIRSIEQLGMPDVVRQLAEEQRGIILVTGTTGSGKSTTLAAMIDHINQTRARHIVTLEDPIEYLHPDKHSIVNQREVGFDTKSFGRAMRRIDGIAPAAVFRVVQLPAERFGELMLSQIIEPGGADFWFIGEKPCDFGRGVDGIDQVFTVDGAKKSPRVFHRDRRVEFCLWKLAQKYRDMRGQ